MVNCFQSPSFGGLFYDILCFVETFKHISVEEAKQLMATKDVGIVDIRDAQSFSQGHIPHAKLVSDENIEIFLQESDKQKPLVCYCYHGISSQSAASFFVSQGFKEVYSIDGGFEQWKKA